MSNLFERIAVRAFNTRCRGLPLAAVAFCFSLLLTQSATAAVTVITAQSVSAVVTIGQAASLSVSNTGTVWTNRAGETITATPLSITNQMVVMMLPSGRSKGLPLRIFPESEQVRIQLALGVASVPSCVVPAWRLFEGQLSSARDAESARASLGFIVKQLKTQADGNAISSTELTYWIARATEKERAARLELLEKIAQSGHLEKVSAVKQPGKE